MEGKKDFIQNIQKRVYESIKKNNLLQTGDYCIIGVSGGADSVALLDILVSLQEKLKIKLLVLHVNHKIRKEEAEQDAKYVETLSQHYKLPYILKEYNVPEYAKQYHLSIEEAGRILRYEAFAQGIQMWKNIEEKIKKNSKDNVCKSWQNRDMEYMQNIGSDFSKYHVAVAHHIEDRVETILIQMMRGSGLKGLAGMDIQRGEIIRPLWEIHRIEIEKYLKDRSISFREDSSNYSTIYTRNRIRHEILPLLLKVNTLAIEHIIELGEDSYETYLYLKKIARQHLLECMQKEKRAIGLDCSYLQKIDKVVRAYIYREAIFSFLKEKEKGLRDISRKHMKQMESLLDAPVGKHYTLPYQIQIRRDYKILWIEEYTLKEEKKSISLQEIILERDFRKDIPIKRLWVEEIFIKKYQIRYISYHIGMEIPEERYRKWFDMDVIKKEIAIRTRAMGDYITLTGGGHKSIKSYMIDSKISAKLRNDIPIIAEGSNVLWIVGYRIGESYKITKYTKNILEIRWLEEKSDELHNK